MAREYFSERNLKFTLFDVHHIESLTRYEYFELFDRESFDLVLDTAAQLADEMLYPHFEDMDRNQPELVDGQVRVRPAVRDFMRAYGEGGWFAAGFPFEAEGQQMPVSLFSACSHIFNSANFSGSSYVGLTSGAALLILSFGDQHLQEVYMPPMLKGHWGGTMALTEPQAGSSLSDLTTSATPTDQGHYLIRGQKIFISAGDHDGVDNIVHLMLARIKGAPAGVKGISLFVVPKYRPENGELIPNDLATAGLFHKMGYKGCPIVQLSMGEEGDCRGWLVGEPNKGLAYMFQMMNESRIGVGMQATSVASAAYYASLDYAKQRPQGRPVDAKDLDQPQVPIIQHADVKRMLLFQRAVVEGSLGLILQAALYADLSRHGPQEEREKYNLMLELLTPVVKSYPSEMGILSTSTGLQILGGYGYCDEYPLEQYFRDMRIHPIHEGTTGIQGMDLLGRKSVMKSGAAVKHLTSEIIEDIAAAQGLAETQPYAARLSKAMALLEQALTARLAVAGQGRIAEFLADATLYLEMFGIVTVAWQWLKQGTAAARKLGGNPTQGESNFCQGKLATMKYFFHYELPKINGLAERLQEDDDLLTGLGSEVFDH